ncbi:putative quinol monooxygenase [Parasediminibacterium paludis]|uniref:Quinol monooxygenase n=1 Tax=Parasediminibacterium paludis TaxID=908966 RepID=A0ABV8PX46_9BACT
MKPLRFTILLITICLWQQTAMAQQSQQMVRLAKIKVDTAQLAAYNAALKLQMQTAITKEAGVLTYYAVADKKDPSSITILEIYADTTAYQHHITTPHFKAYKEAVKNMVLSLELVDVSLIGAAVKPQ